MNTNHFLSRVLGLLCPQMCMNPWRIWLYFPRLVKNVFDWILLYKRTQIKNKKIILVRKYVKISYSKIKRECQILIILKIFKLHKTVPFLIHFTDNVTFFLIPWSLFCFVLFCFCFCFLFSPQAFLVVYRKLPTSWDLDS
jgi:hypothetical protein